MEPWSLEELRSGGIQAVLNVSEFESKQSNFDEAGLELEWIPFPASYPATDETEIQCLELLPKAYSFVTSCIEKEKTVLVHCSWGRDRSGLILAYHLALVMSLSPRNAIAQLSKVRPKAITALGWEEMAVRVIDKLMMNRKC